MSWKLTNLGTLIDVLSGFAFDSKKFSDSSGKPLIRIRDIKRSYTETYYNGNFEEKYVVKSGDVLIGMDGEFNVAEWNGTNALLNQRVCKVTVKDPNHLDLRYLLYFLPYELKLIEDKASFVTVKHLSVNDVKNIQIPLPPLAAQKRIAEILDASDALRRKDQALLKKYDELAQAIFIDMFGDPVKNEKGWDVTSISGIFDVISGGTPSTKNPEYWENGDIPWIGSSLCKDNFVFKSNGKFITSKGLENSSAKMIPKNTVIIALVGATIGKIGLIKFETCTNQNVAALIPKNKETISEIFTFYMMKSLYHKFEEVGGDKFKMANLAFVKSLPFLSPPINLQIEFSEIITQIINLKKSTENGLGDDLFNTCIQKAFKGELVS